MTSSPRSSRLEHWVHWTLLAGVIASGTLGLVGLTLIFAGSEPRPDGPPPSIAVLFKSALKADGVAITELALLLLMVTPLARVAVLAVGWCLEGNRRFALVALAVLALLAMSLSLGIG